MFLFVGVPRVILELYTNISPITAKVSSFILHYAGFPVTLEGVFIYLPKGAIEVYAGCSGVEAMTYVLSIAIVSLIMFPIRKKDQYYVPILALAIGFVVNAFRVVLMAILVNSGRMEAFKYWHEGEGSLIFGMIAVCTFAGFYWLLMNKADNSNKINSHNETAIREESFF